MTDDHRQNLLASFGRYRKDIVGFFHSEHDARTFRDRFPGITFGHVFASIKVFETGSNPSAVDTSQFQAAVFEADKLMAAYQAGYEINADSGYCEMKYIYFPGWAYARALQAAGEVAEREHPESVRAQALLYASSIVRLQVIGYLTNFLKLFGVDKTGLKKSLARRAIAGLSESDLGDFGCYLIYKCVSTARDHRIETIGSA